MTSEREATKRLRNYQEMSEDDIEPEEEGEGDDSSDHDLNSSDDEEGSLMDDDEERSVKTGPKRRRKLRCGRGAANGGHTQSNGGQHPTLSYKYVGHWKENHGHPLFGIAINHQLEEDEPVVFATVGFNRVTVYEAVPDGVKLVQCYADPDTDENFYTCAWSYDVDSGALARIHRYRYLCYINSLELKFSEH